MYVYMYMFNRPSSNADELSLSGSRMQASDIASVTFSSELKDNTLSNRHSRGEIPQK